MAGFATEFKNPGKAYRAAPFWSWNDRLTDEELVWQIDQMRAAGMGGFFMHSRSGLITPFLGEEWMARVRTCVEHARQVEMNAWLYDEDRWPSGTAGGLVTGPHPEFQMRPLVKIELAPGEALPQEGDLVAVFAEPEEGTSTVSIGSETEPVPFSDVTASPASAQDRKRLVFYVPPARPSPWYNNTAYLDTLNPQAVREFIRVAYASYEGVIGAQFGKTVPGVFTDEPNYLNFRVGARKDEVPIPWTSGLPAFFRERRGYDLLPCLPSLFLPVGTWRKVRHDFWQTVTERFVESFTKQIGEWCGSRGLLFTGHMLWEESLEGQIRVVGAAMPHYEHMQAPGVDILRERIAETVTLKQCSSVAHQLGRKWVLSELYGVTGWQFTFEGMKWIGDWHAVLGVNLRCPHLTLYSLRGCRKRDYPPSFNYQSPWWGDYRMVEDHFARVNRVLTEGAFAADILLLHPITSAWGLYAPGKDEPVQAQTTAFVDLCETLLGLHRDFDLGDESLLARHAKVLADGGLRVGKMVYRAVVVPAMPSVERATLGLLKAFAAAGGPVIALTPVPTMVAGVESDEAAEFFRSGAVSRVRGTRGAIEKALDQALPRRVSVLDARGKGLAAVWCHERTGRNRRFYFFANTDRERGYDAVIELPVGGHVSVLDTETGAIRPVAAAGGKRTTKLAHRFEPASSLALVVNTSRPPHRAPRRSVRPAEVERIRLRGPWAFARSAPNALTLDTCRYRIGEGEWSAAVPVWRAHEDIVAHFGLATNRGNGGVQYWKLYPEAKMLGGDARIALEFTFQVDALPATPMSVALESPERFSIALNGSAVDNRPSGWYVDKAFRVVPLGGAVRQGTNTLELAAVMSQDLELESAYLIGDFAVDRTTRAIRGPEPAELTLGDWCDQGYPYYAGTMTYRARVTLPDLAGRRVMLKLEQFSAAVVRVRVNGTEAGRRGWAPYAVDLTDRARPGPNDIEIDLVATNRNLLGPHHFNVPPPAWVGPGQFSDEKHWTDEYLLWPYGLMSAPWIILG